MKLLLPSPPCLPSAALPPKHPTPLAVVIYGPVAALGGLAGGAGMTLHIAPTTTCTHPWDTARVPMHQHTHTPAP